MTIHNTKIKIKFDQNMFRLLQRQCIHVIGLALVKKPWTHLNVKQKLAQLSAHRARQNQSSRSLPLRKLKTCLFQTRRKEGSHHPIGPGFQLEFRILSLANPQDLHWYILLIVPEHQQKLKHRKAETHQCYKNNKEKRNQNQKSTEYCNLKLFIPSVLN